MCIKQLTGMTSLDKCTVNFSMEIEHKRVCLCPANLQFMAGCLAFIQATKKIIFEIYTTAPILLIIFATKFMLCFGNF